jgi:hypothetical protein
LPGRKSIPWAISMQLRDNECREQRDDAESIQERRRLGVSDNPQ